MDRLSRRQFLAAPALIPPLRGGRLKTILLRGGWQTVNIGDAAQAPGALRLIERHLADARVILWPAHLEDGVAEMLERHFPKLDVALGNVVNGTPDTPELRAAFRDADLLFHASAPSVTSVPQLEAWKQATSKPYGFFGIGCTLQSGEEDLGVSPRVRGLLKDAAFVFARETTSLANLERLGVRGPLVGFAPDGTFSMELRDEPRGLAFLKQSGLDAGGFLVAIPRLRYTPYHKFRKTVPWSAEEVRRRTAVSEKHQEEDHAKLREVIVRWVRATGRKALLCPEMTYQIEIIDPLLYDPLPDDVKRRVVRRKSFWLPDEAAAVYRRAAAVVSYECHSPILATAQEVPCMYVHQPEDGIKGQMWKDIGLGEWYFEVEQVSGADVYARLQEVHADAAAAKKKISAARRYVQDLHGRAFSRIRAALENG